MWDEGRLREYAREKHGLIDRTSALRFEATDHYIQTCLRLNRWTELHHGVYYLNVTPRTWETELLAAVMAAGPTALASHRSAARVWGLHGVYGGPIELTVPYSQRPMPQGVTVHRTRRSIPEEIRLSIPVTSVERTLLDVAGLIPDRALEKATESALRHRLSSIESLARSLKQHGGRGVKGTRRMRRVLAAVEGDVAGSPAEVELRDLMRDAPIPMPTPQLEVRLPTGENAYPDFSWPDRMRIVEVDGFEAHSTPEQLQHDLRRQNMLMDLGWEIRRFSARDVRRTPLEVIAEIVRFVES